MVRAADVLALVAMWGIALAKLVLVAITIGTVMRPTRASVVIVVRAGGLLTVYGSFVMGWEWWSCSPPPVPGPWTGEPKPGTLLRCRVHGLCLWASACWRRRASGVRASVKRSADRAHSDRVATGA